MARDEITPADEHLSSDRDRVRSLLYGIAAEISAVATATTRHVIRAVKFGALVLHCRFFLKRDVINTEEALGKAMYSSGKGDEKLRSRISELLDTISSLEAAESSSSAGTTPADTQLNSAGSV